MVQSFAEVCRNFKILIKFMRLLLIESVDAFSFDLFRSGRLNRLFIVIKTLRKKLLLSLMHEAFNS
jgi:hypothetical protein